MNTVSRVMVIGPSRFRRGPRFPGRWSELCRPGSPDRLRGEVGTGRREVGLRSRRDRREPPPPALDLGDPPRIHAEEGRDIVLAVTPEDHPPDQGRVGGGERNSTRFCANKDDAVDPRFAVLVESLAPKLEELLARAPLQYGSLPPDMPSSGVYLFSEDGRHLYVGRSNSLRGRYLLNPGNRAEYLNERRAMMKHWADYVDSLRDNSRVVSMRPHSRAHTRSSDGCYCLQLRHAA
jgi:hypothetical protein